MNPSISANLIQEKVTLNFHLLEVVFRYRDPQLQAGENYSHVLILTPNIWKSSCLDTFSARTGYELRLVKKKKHLQDSSLILH